MPWHRERQVLTHREGRSDAVLGPPTSALISDARCGHIPDGADCCRGHLGNWRPRGGALLLDGGEVKDDESHHRGDQHGDDRADAPSLHRLLCVMQLLPEIVAQTPEGEVQLALKLRDF